MTTRDSMSRRQTRQNADMPFMTIREVAKELHLSVSSVQRLIDHGALEAHSFAPPGARRQTLRVDRAELDRYIASTRITPDDDQ
jgi:excisionase family DNA binding protein